MSRFIKMMYSMIFRGKIFYYGLSSQVGRVKQTISEVDEILLLRTNKLRLFIKHAYNTTSQVRIVCRINEKQCTVFQKHTVIRIEIFYLDKILA